MDNLFQAVRDMAPPRRNAQNMAPCQAGHMKHGSPPDGTHETWFPTRQTARDMLPAWQKNSRQFFHKGTATIFTTEDHLP